MAQNLSPLPAGTLILSSFPPRTRGADEAPGGENGELGVARADAWMPTTGQSRTAPMAGG